MTVYYKPRYHIYSVDVAPVLSRLQPIMNLERCIWLCWISIHEPSGTRVRGAQSVFCRRLSFLPGYLCLRGET